MTTTNQMIFATLKTKACKPAKYAEQLRELGYEVTNMETYGDNEYEREYWSVNGKELYKPDKGAMGITLRGCKYVEKLENIARIDFVNYFATLEERRAKAERMTAHDEIGETRTYQVRKERVYVDERGRVVRWWEPGTHAEYRRRHRRQYDSVNYTVDEYRKLKRKAEARGWWYNDTEDSRIRDAEAAVERAEARVEKLWKELEEAERAVEQRKAELQKAHDYKAEGQDELDAWLKARGIR